MRQIRETLRLHLQAGLSYGEVGRALKISKSAVGKYVHPGPGGRHRIDVDPEVVRRARDDLDDTGT